MLLSTRCLLLALVAHLVVNDALAYQLLPLPSGKVVNSEFTALAGIAKGSKLFVRYIHMPSSEYLEFISTSILGSSVDIYSATDGGSTAHNVPTDKGCFRAVDGATCTPWENLEEVVIDTRTTIRWRMNCSDISDGTADWYEVFVDKSEGTIQRFRLPSSFVPLGTDFDLSNSSLASVRPARLPSCWAVEKGYAKSDTPSSLPTFIKSLECPLECSALYNPCPSPHPAAVCNKEEGVWKIPDLGSTALTAVKCDVIVEGGSVGTDFSVTVSPHCGKLTLPTGADYPVKITLAAPLLKNSAMDGQQTFDLSNVITAPSGVGYTYCDGELTGEAAGDCNYCHKEGGNLQVACNGDGKCASSLCKVTPVSPTPIAASAISLTSAVAVMVVALLFRS